jgi:hypothetical protein
MTFILNKEKELKLTRQIYSSDIDKYSLHFSKEYDKSVIISFVNLKNEIVSSLEMEKIYFLSTFIDSKQYFIYRGYGENNLFGKISDDLDGRIFLFLPKISKNYTTSSNLNGCFFISGKSIVDAFVAEFNSKASDVIWLTLDGCETKTIFSRKNNNVNKK